MKTGHKLQVSKLAGQSAKESNDDQTFGQEHVQPFTGRKRSAQRIATGIEMSKKGADENDKKMWEGVKILKENVIHVANNCQNEDTERSVRYYFRGRYIKLFQYCYSSFIFLCSMLMGCLGNGVAGHGQTLGKIIKGVQLREKELSAENISLNQNT